MQDIFLKLRGNKDTFLKLRGDKGLYGALPQARALPRA